MNGIDIKINLPGGANTIVVYDAASNCLTSAYKQSKNNYYDQASCIKIG